MRKVGEGDKVKVDGRDGVVTRSKVVGTGTDVVRVVTVRTEDGRTVWTSAENVVVTKKAWVK